MAFFREVDDIVSLGKWAYNQIPSGKRCKGCPLLGQDEKNWYCGLRPSISLLRDTEGPFKDQRCPVVKGG